MVDTSSEVEQSINESIDSWLDRYTQKTENNRHVFVSELLPTESDTSELCASAWEPFSKTFVLPKLSHGERILETSLLFHLHPCRMADGSFVRYCDYVAFAVIERVETYRANEVFRYTTGHDLYLRHNANGVMGANAGDILSRFATYKESEKATHPVGIQHLVALPFDFTQMRGCEDGVVVRFKGLASIVQTDVNDIGALLSGIKLRVKSERVIKSVSKHKSSI